MSEQQRKYREWNDGGGDDAWRPAPGRVPASARIMRSARDERGVADGAEAAVAQASSSSGAPLPSEIRTKFESSLGADLSSVRVHTGASSADAASAVGARAYTVGNDIHFADGEYAPADPFGIHLLAHEVAHTQQQAGGTPTRQHKLEVSSPGDAAEHEADRAADAMIAGLSFAVAGSATVLSRTPDPQPLGDPGAASKQTPFADPRLEKLGVAAPTASYPNTLESYDIPTKDYRAAIPDIVPPLGEAMPTANIPDPGAIPGWWVTVPSSQVSPLKAGVEPITFQGGKMLISGDHHAANVKTAWTAYASGLIPNVSSTWNSGAKPKMDAYVGAAKGDAQIEAMVADLAKNWNVTNATTGKGNLATRAHAQEIENGKNASEIGADAAAATEKGDMSKHLHDMSQQPADTTRGDANDVKNRVDELNAHRNEIKGSMGRLFGFGGMYMGASSLLSAAEASTNALKAEDAKKEAEARKSGIEDGSATVKKQFGDASAKLMATAKAIFGPLKDMGEGVAKIGEGELGGALTVGKGVLELHKWKQLESIEDEIGQLEQIAHDNKQEAAAKCAGGALAMMQGARKCAEGERKTLEGLLVKEKQLYEHLSTSVRKNYKGTPEDGAIAARALTAIPIVEKMMRTLDDIHGSLPEPPPPSTREAQGYTLATEGVHGHGAAALLKVAGWIRGSKQAIAMETARWTAIRANLTGVEKSLGVV